MELDAFFFCMMNLFCSGRKFLLAPTIYDMGFCPQTESRTRRIHRHITTADNNHLAARVDWCIIMQISFHQIIPCQIFIGGEYAVGLFARNSHEFWKSGTGTDKYCIKTFFIHQLIDRHRFSDNHICFNLNPKFFNIFNLMGYHLILWQTEFRNSINKYASSLMKSFKNLHLIPHLCQISGTGQPCRARTNDSYSFRTLFLCLCRRHPILTGPISHKTLKFSYRNRVALLTKNTFALTLGFLWTYTPADRRQR